VQVNHDLDIVIPCPTNYSVEVFGLSLDIGFTPGNVVGPEADGYTDMIQTGGYDASTGFPQRMPRGTKGGV